MGGTSECLNLFSFPRIHERDKGMHIQSFNLSVQVNHPFHKEGVPLSPLVTASLCQLLVCPKLWCVKRDDSLHSQKRVPLHGISAGIQPFTYTGGYFCVQRLPFQLLTPQETRASIFQTDQCQGEDCKPPSTRHPLDPFRLLHKAEQLGRPCL